MDSKQNGRHEMQNSGPDRLRHLKALGLEYRVTAALLGITQPYLSYLVNKKRNMQKSQTVKVEWLCRAMEDLTKRFKAKFGEAS